MAHPSIEVKIRAGRPSGRPAQQGTFDLPQRGAPRRQSSVVGRRGVASWDPATASAWRVSNLALKWLPNVADRARGYLRFGAVPSPVNARGLHPPVRSGQAREVTQD